MELPYPTTAAGATKAYSLALMSARNCTLMFWAAY